MQPRRHFTWYYDDVVIMYLRIAPNRTSLLARRVKAQSKLVPALDDLCADGDPTSVGGLSDGCRPQKICTLAVLKFKSHAATWVVAQTGRFYRMAVALSD